MREFIKTYQNVLKKNNKINIATIYIDNQKEFMSAFKKKNFHKEINNKKSLLVIWRYEYFKVRYTWLLNFWSSDENNMQENFDMLRKQLDSLSCGLLPMDNIGKIVDLVILIKYNFYKLF